MFNMSSWIPNDIELRCQCAFSKNVSFAKILQLRNFFQNFTNIIFLENAHWDCNSMSLNIHEKILNMTDVPFTVIVRTKLFLRWLNVSVVTADL